MNKKSIIPSIKSLRIDENQEKIFDVGCLRFSMKEVISTPNAPGAIGPYSQGIKIGDLLFTAGQIALDPKTGSLINDTLESEVNQIMNNLIGIISEAGSTLEHAVKTTIYLIDMDDFSIVNKIYASHFKGSHPARSTVEVSNLPAGARVEIDMIVFVPKL